MTCQILVFGPMSAGEPMSSGELYRVSGWGWSCATHHCADHGLPSEQDADQAADAHVRAYAS